MEAANNNRTGARILTIPSPPFVCYPLVGGDRGRLHAAASQIVLQDAIVSR